MVGRQCREPVIWLTLDSADDDPVRLWTHLATAVERLDDGLGVPALSCLGGRDVPVETAVDELMNGLAAYGRPVAVVLDDLDTVGSERSLRSIAHAIERLPDNARLLLASRSDPAISVACLRARGELTEIRARELAFTVDEAHELMVREGIELSGESIELLVARTEGWPAGLYLAALWLRDLEDPDQGVRAFAGSARHVADYLTDEVLSALDFWTRDFVVRTAALGRFTPDLCDAALEREDSAAILAELARSNMFLVALDAREQWYRYHHLFGEVLALELGREDASALRRRAATWCREQGLVEDALEHAAAAQDAETVAELLVEHDRQLVWGGQVGLFLRWVRWLPLELLLEHPSLAAGGAVAAALLARPEVEVERLLAVAERARRERPQLWSPYAEAIVEVTRSEVIERGDVGAAVGHARRAVAAARAGADAPDRGGTCEPRAGAVLRRRSRSSAPRRACRPSNAPTRRTSPTAMSETSGCSPWSTPSKGEPRARRRGLLRRLASRATDSKRIPGLRRWRTSDLLWRARRAGRLDEAEREALRGERLRRSPQPTVGHTHALLVLAQVRIARSRLASAARVLKRAHTAIAGFPDPGRLPAIAASIERDLTIAEANAGNGHLVEEPSPAELAVLRYLATGLSRRDVAGAALHLTEHRQEPHARAVPQARRYVASGRGCARRGARPARWGRITRVILGPHGPNRGRRASWWFACRRIATAS